MVRRELIAILAAGLFLGGCVAHTWMPPAPEETLPIEVETAQTDHSFTYTPGDVPFKNAVLDSEESKYYRVRYIRFPSIGDNGQRDDLVTGKYYESKLPGKRPLIIVLPLWGGHVYPSAKITGYLKRHSDGGVHVFRMLGERHLTDWPALRQAKSEEAFLDLWRRTAQRERNTVIDIRRIIDWAGVRSEVDTDRIGLVAFSRGAMMAALVAANDDRLAATALIMGGAHPNEAVALCPMLRDRGVQKMVQKEFGWTLDEFAARLEPIYHGLDPANYPGTADPERILIVEAGKDQCIPAHSREALYEAMGRPARIVIPYGHKRSFLSMTPLGLHWLEDQIWDFFQDSF